MKKNITILMFTLSIIAIILVVCAFIFLLKIIKNKNEQTSAVIITLQEKMKEKEDLVKFSEKVAEIKSIQTDIDSHFVDPNKIDVFVGYLEDMGISIGSEVLVTNIEVPPKTKNIMTFRVSIMGTFQNVSETIALLENIPYQIDITQIYLNKDIQKIPQGNILENKTTEDPHFAWQADVSFNILSLE